MYLKEVFMTEKTIDYVPISKLSRGYAGQMIDNMYKKESVVFILRNNEPTAVILSMEDYKVFLELMKNSQRINKKDISTKIAGSLHRFSDVQKIEGERDFYRKAMHKRNG